MPSKQYRWFIVTLPVSSGWEPALPLSAQYCRGQRELSESGYDHWQFVVYFRKRLTLTAAKRVLLPVAHLEPTRSSAALAYCWKESTRVEGSQFEFGNVPIDRSNPADWEKVWDHAVSGAVLEIPADIRIRCYFTIRRISADFCVPVAISRRAVVYYGPTGTGKSRRAWNEAGMDAYPKDPRTKFWCGYQGQRRVVVDEFRGGVDAAHLLRWLDRYPVIVELKGSSAVLNAEEYWFTSNLHPKDWYPDLDPLTYSALERRLEIILVE